MCSLVPRPCTFVTWISRRILYCNANFILQATNSKAWERGYIMWPWLTNILWLQVCPSVSHTQSKQREREREREKKKTKKKEKEREKKNGWLSAWCCMMSFGNYVCYCNMTVLWLGNQYSLLLKTKVKLKGSFLGSMCAQVRPSVLPEECCKQQHHLRCLSGEKLAALCSSWQLFTDTIGFDF